MIIRLLLAGVYMINVSLGLCQVRGDYNWILGNFSSPMETPLPLGIEIQFSMGGIFTKTLYRPYEMNYFNASYSDDTGNLLLYSNGCDIRNRGHKLVAGTSSLSPGSTDYEWCFVYKGGYPVFESGLFLPFNTGTDIFLLHQRLRIEGPPLQVYVDSLYYTSLTAEEAEFVLQDKTVPLVGSYLIDGNLEATKAISSNAWWVLQEERASNRYFAILFDAAQIDTIFIQEIGDAKHKGSAAGQAAFSPDGAMYARYNPDEQLFLFDFDRATGILSNYRKIHVADSGFVGGLAFSPNSRFIYACTNIDMYQFDTWAEDIENSKVHLGHFDGYAAPFPATFYHMQPGPDCRIYIGTPNGIDVWHLIHEPDKKGPECRFEQHGFHFPVSNSITMPNFPNYRLDIAPVCDPGIATGFFTTGHAATTPAHIYPNPTDGPLWVKLSAEWGAEQEIRVSINDYMGRLWHTSRHLPSDHTLRLGLEALPPGLYVIHLQSEGRVWSGKMVRE